MVIMVHVGSVVASVLLLFVSLCTALPSKGDGGDLTEGQLGFGADCYLKMGENYAWQKNKAEFHCASTHGTQLTFKKLKSGRYFISAGDCPLFWTYGPRWNTKLAVFRCGRKPGHGFWVEKQSNGMYEVSAKVSGRKCPLFRPGGTVKGIATISRAQFRCNGYNEDFWIRPFVPGPTTTPIPATTAPPDPFVFGVAGSVSCPRGYSVLTDEQQCEKQVTAWARMFFDVAGCWRFGAIGCFVNTRHKQVSFNTCKNPRGTAKHHTPVCKLDEPFVLGVAGSVTCPPGYSVVTDKQQCEKQVTAWAGMIFDYADCWRFGTIGCFVNTKNKQVSYSTCKNPRGTAKHHTPVCKRDDGSDSTTTAPATTSAVIASTAGAVATTEGAVATTEGAPEAPSTAAAATEIPSTAAAATEIPSTAAADTKIPSTAEVVSEAPSTAAVVSEAPSTAAVVSEAPSTAAVVSEGPSTAAAAVSEGPSTAAAVASETPSTAKAVSEAPSTVNATTGAPATTKKN